MNFMKELVDLFFEKVLNVTEDNIGDDNKLQEYQLTSKSKKNNLNKSVEVLNTGDSRRKRNIRNKTNTSDNEKTITNKVIKEEKTQKIKRKQGVNFVKIEEKPDEEDFNTNDQIESKSKPQINVFTNIRNLSKIRPSILGFSNNNEEIKNNDKKTLKEEDEYSNLKSIIFSGDNNIKNSHKKSTKTKKFSYLLNKQSLLSNSESKDKSDYFKNSDSSEEKYENPSKKSISTPSKNLLKSLIVKEKKLSDSMTREKSHNDELLSSDIVKINSLMSEKGILGRNSKEISKFNYKDKQLRDSFYNKFSNKDYENSSNKNDVNILSNNANNLKVSKSVLKKDDFLKNLTNKIVI